MWRSLYTDCSRLRGWTVELSQLTAALTVQVLFPESYAETAAWLRKEVVANAEILRRCEAQLDDALRSNAQLRDLVADVKVSSFASNALNALIRRFRLRMI